MCDFSCFLRSVLVSCTQYSCFHPTGRWTWVDGKNWVSNSEQHDRDADCKFIGIYSSMCGVRECVCGIGNRIEGIFLSIYIFFLRIFMAISVTGRLDQWPCRVWITIQWTAIIQIFQRIGERSIIFFGCRLGGAMQLTPRLGKRG